MTPGIGARAFATTVLAVAAASTGAGAEPAKAMFCIAVRTVPVLDQDNYVMGGTGPVYMTPNFTTDLPDDQLKSQWAGFIAARHPAAYPGNPDDTCYPANTRRALIAGQKGDIRNVSVAWPPPKAAGH